MPEFRVTFGSQYPRESHPRFSLAHRDGWVTIIAADELDARLQAIYLLGTAWCDLYAEGSWDDWDPSWFTKGEVARFVTALAARPVIPAGDGAEHLAGDECLIPGGHCFKRPGEAFMSNPAKYCEVCKHCGGSRVNLAL